MEPITEWNRCNIRSYGRCRQALACTSHLNIQQLWPQLRMQLQGPFGDMRVLGADMCAAMQLDMCAAMWVDMCATIVAGMRVENEGPAARCGARAGQSQHYFFLSCSAAYLAGSLAYPKLCRPCPCMLQRSGRNCTGDVQILAHRWRRRHVCRHVVITRCDGGWSELCAWAITI